MKIKSLADEARIIRREERRRRGPIHGPSETRLQLHLHRTRDVRMEARASLLAYAFLRGRSLQQVEGKTTKPYKFERAAKVAEKFSCEDARVIRQRFAEWSGS